MSVGKSSNDDEYVKELLDNANSTTVKDHNYSDPLEDVKKPSDKQLNKFVEKISTKIRNEVKRINQPKKYFYRFPVNTNNPIDIYHISDALNVNFVKRWKKDINFHCFAISGDKYMSELYVMLDYSKEHNGCKNWYMIGRFMDLDPNDTGLKNVDDVMGAHTVRCWHRKYIAVKDIIGKQKDKFSKSKILDDLGWNKIIELYGLEYDSYSTYCNCGWDKVND